MVFEQVSQFALWNPRTWQPSGVCSKQNGHVSFHNSLNFTGNPWLPESDSSLFLLIYTVTVGSILTFSSSLSEVIQAYSPFLTTPRKVIWHWLHYPTHKTVSIQTGLICGSMLVEQATKCYHSICILHYLQESYSPNISKNLNLLTCYCVAICKCSTFTAIWIDSILKEYTKAWMLFLSLVNCFQ